MIRQEASRGPQAAVLPRQRARRADRTVGIAVAAALGAAAAISWTLWVWTAFATPPEAPAAGETAVAQAAADQG